MATLPSTFYVVVTEDNLTDVLLTQLFNLFIFLKSSRGGIDRFHLLLFLNAIIKEQQTQSGKFRCFTEDYLELGKI